MVLKIGAPARKGRRMKQAKRQQRDFRISMAALWLCGLAACSRGDIARALPGKADEPGRDERCNGLDDDEDSKVDEAFRDALGRYVDDAHCGGCNMVCTPPTELELAVACQIVDDVPRCVATSCAPGYAPSDGGPCVAVGDRLCLTCAQDDDCGSLQGARCANIGGEARCTITCELGCPQGFRCDDDVCIPEGGSCSCEPGQFFELACPIDTGIREPGAPVCVGHARCEDGVLSECVTTPEVCDEVDNDCDGVIDGPFRNEVGGYDDAANCGQCGVTCLEETGVELDLVCGGDPFSPQCVLSCPDATDGIEPGDQLDGDLDIATGCECTVTSLTDTAGPLRASGENLDLNCDGADGIVVESFYVAADGHDDWPGSPTRPLRTINVAIERAAASLFTGTPRPHVFVASGAYTETIVMADGVSLHGGYRRDFRALDPVSFVVDVRAPAPAVAPGGAALVGTNVGDSDTRVEWITVQGLDASDLEEATFGAYFEEPGPRLVLSELILRSGVPGQGLPGSDGAAGAAPSSNAVVGAEPRAARENGLHECNGGNANRVAGGSGGVSQCGNSSANGGGGGSASCPAFGDTQGGGATGSGNRGGSGGNGGEDASGPIDGDACFEPSGICCGLADFQVPTDFQGPQTGENGGDGSAGSAGSGCSDARGRFDGVAWRGAQGSAGQSGGAGSGGGGGGAGGGVAMDWVDFECEFADGLGGGGGGGGAGGCGGTGGRAGSSGAPSIALLLVDPGRLTLRNIEYEPSAGGRGGDGGAGGDGGQGGAGAFGGALDPAERTTPTLAGTFPGARGGSGGDGGAGGGGGGGCGGSSVAVWVLGSAPGNMGSWTGSQLSGLGGEGGRGGSGVNEGGRGQRGEEVFYVVQP
jgi:hypothetical protein